MIENRERSLIATKTVVYEVPGMADVQVRRDLPYGSGDTRPAFDLYLRPDSARKAPPPVVLLVTGYPDPSGKSKSMGAYTSWARLLAASGLAVITYTNRDPVSDLEALLAHVAAHAAALGVDASRVAMWSCSGNAPTALSLLFGARAHALAGMVLCYAYLFDTADSRAVADAAARFGFVDACAGRESVELSRSVPLLVVRAGEDRMPGLNAALDRFVCNALAQNLELSVINHAAAPHAFDILDDTDSSRDVIRRIVSFLDFHLRARS